MFLFLLTPFFISAFAENRVSPSEVLEKAPHQIKSNLWANRSQEKDIILDFLNNELQEEKKFQISFESGLDGHKTKAQSLYTVDVGADVEKGVYPFEFRFKAGAKIKFKDNELIEEVTKLLLNFDYHLSPRWKIYTFVERFSDTYLSIRHRYELGGGLMYQWESEVKRKFKIKEKDKIEEYSWDKILAHFNRQSKQKKEELKNMEQIFSKKYSTWAWSIAFTIFSELEQAVIKSDAEDTIKNDALDPQDVTLPSEQRFRWVLRPQVICRPLENLTLKAWGYCKFPLGSPNSSDGIWDFRFNGGGRSEFSLPLYSKWAKSISIIFEYLLNYDKAPPTISDKIKNEYLAQNIKLLDEKAEKLHHEFKFKLKISF